MSRAWLIAPLLAACVQNTGPGVSDDTDGGDSETGPAAPPGDECETTRLVLEAPTTLTATLRNASSAPAVLAEACPSLTGPTIYVEATTHARADLSVSVRSADLTPTFAVMLPGCTTDPARVLTCGGLLPVTLTDVGPDAEVLIAIGASDTDPALELPASGDTDPVEFELRLDVRPVLSEFDHCGPALGRCEAGTVCLTELEDGTPVARCRRPAADSCRQPGVSLVPVPGGELVIPIPAEEPHSDAHEHSCAGWRRPERVERLELPADLGPNASLIIEADDPSVGLALRGSDCAPDHELACAPATGANDTSSLIYAGPGELAALAAAEEGPLLFIELPGSNPRVDVEVRVRTLE